MTALGERGIPVEEVHSSFAVRVLRRGYCSIVAVSGELDVAGAVELREALRDLQGDIYIDCRDLTFVDTAGVGLLVATHDRCSRYGGRLTLYGLHGASRRAFDVLGVDGLFELNDVNVSTVRPRRAGTLGRREQPAP
jgi:anti-sigma B factor antagonist